MGVGIRRTVALLVLVGFLVSLALPVAQAGAGPANAYPGWGIVLMGWLGVLILQFGWFANVLLIPALVLLLIRDRPPRWLVLGVAGGLAACGLDALTWANIPSDNSEGPISAYYSGYYLWLATVALASFATATMGWPPRRVSEDCGSREELPPS